VHHALGGDQRVGHFLDRRCFALEDQNFEAIVMIQVDVQRREDEMKVVVLHGREPVRQKPHVMIVNQRERADDEAIRLPGSLLDERFADEVAKRFGAAGIPALVNVIVEAGEKVGIDGYADAAEIAHLLSA